MKVSLLGLGFAIVVQVVGVIILEANDIEYSNWSFLLGWIASVFYDVGKEMKGNERK